MSYLMAEQLINNEVITTKVTLLKNCIITSVRLHLYRKNLITGNLAIRLYNNSDLLGHGIITMNELNSIPGTYFHGMIDIELEKPVQINLIQSGYELDVEIEMFDYTDSDDNYVALIREPNPNVPVNEVFDSPTIDESDAIWLSPFSLELFSYRG